MSGRLELIIYDRDAGYLKLLTEYIRETEWSRTLTVKQATKPEMLREYAHDGSAALYVVHSDFGEADAGWGFVIRLCETKQEADEAAPGMPGIYKYQPLHQLLGRILGLYRAQAESVRASSAGRRTPVYTVFSAAGGVGKTTIAQHMARAIAAQGERCLYWNMELVPGSVLPKETDEELAARFVYGLRTNAAWTTDSLNGLLYRAEPYGFDYFPGFRKFRETIELTAEDAGKLIGQLKQLGRYDAIVFDPDTSLGERVRGTLSLSDAVLCIVTEDGDSAARSFKLLAEWEEAFGDALLTDRNKLRFVLNKHTGSVSGTLPAPSEMTPSTVPLAGKLPYVPAWKQMHGASGKPSAEPLFTESIVKLLSELRRSEGGMPNVDRLDYADASRNGS